jgi:hypothetical protein
VWLIQFFLEHDTAPFPTGITSLATRTFRHGLRHFVHQAPSVLLNWAQKFLKSALCESLIFEFILQRKS